MTVVCWVFSNFNFVSYKSVNRIWAIPAHVRCVVSSLAVWTKLVCFCIWSFGRLIFTSSFLFFANSFSAFFDDVFLFFAVSAFYLMLFGFLWLRLLV